MRYDYKCNDCSTDVELVVFEVSHGMRDKPEIICPVCKKKNCERAILDVSKHWVRGYGWLDVKGRRNDMNAYKLATADPYAHMRESGEADDLMIRMKNKGKVKSRGRTVMVYGGQKGESRAVKKFSIRRVKYDCI